jgi:hypothetical protein
MRIQWGSLPETPEPQPVGADWQPIRGPSQRWGYALAVSTGVVLTFVLLTGIVLSALSTAPGPEPAAEVPTPTTWGIVLLTVLLSVPAHELLHLVWHHRLGFSSGSVIVVWLRRLRFGVYYEGEMSRTRWLLMRATPLVVLSLLPACLFLLFPDAAWDLRLETSLAILLLVNGLGSGGDLVAMLVVFFQVPAAAGLRFHQGRAYWRLMSPVGQSSLPSSREHTGRTGHE